MAHFKKPPHYSLTEGTNSEEIMGFLNNQSFKTITCKNCNSSFNSDEVEAYCPSCGKPFKQDFIICNKCGFKNSYKWMFCTECGNNIKDVSKEEMFKQTALLNKLLDKTDDMIGYLDLIKYGTCRGLL